MSNGQFIIIANEQCFENDSNRKFLEKKKTKSKVKSNGAHRSSESYCTMVASRRSAQKINEIIDFGIRRAIHFVVVRVDGHFICWSYRIVEGPSDYLFKVIDSVYLTTLVL